MMFDGLQEPVHWHSLSSEDREVAKALVTQLFPRERSGVERGAYFSFWQKRVEKAILFLGRLDGRVAALGCMSVSTRIDSPVARIHEVVVDTSYDDIATQREIFFRLTSWAAVATSARTIELDDRKCRIARELLHEAMFHPIPGVQDSHLWRSRIPSGDDQ